MQAQPPSSSDPNALLSVDYSTVGGRDRGPGVHEHESHLRVDFVRNVVELRQHSPPSDTEDDPIGHFRMELDPADEARLTQRTNSIKLGELPPPSGGGPGTSLITLRITRRGGAEEARFSSRDMAVLPKVNPLLEPLDSLLGKLFEKPLQAVRLELKEGPRPDGRFRFALRNVGTMPLAIIDPRASTTAGLTGVRFAPLPPSRPGYTDPPLQWTLVPVVGAAPRAGKGVPVTLPPGTAIDLETAPFTGKAGAHFIAQATLSIYDGPPAYQGMPVIKGRLFSASVEFDGK